MCFRKKVEVVKPTVEEPKPKYKLGTKRLIKYWSVDDAEYRYALYTYRSTYLGRYDGKTHYSYDFESEVSNKSLDWANKTAKHFKIEIKEIK